MDTSTLKFVNDKPPVRVDRKIARRTKLADGAMLQSGLAKDEASGTKITTKRWYWKEADGSYRASLKFGRTVLELAKEKFSVRCDTLDEVSKAFEKLAEMVAASQFDEQLDRIALATRKQFNKGQKATSD